MNIYEISFLVFGLVFLTAAIVIPLKITMPHKEIS